MLRKTSIDVYHQIQAEGLLTKRRWEAYVAMYNSGPMTAQQLTLRCGVSGGWKRLSELERQGAVEVVGEVECPVTGRQVLLWDVTDARPRPFQPEATPKDLLEAFQALTERALKGIAAQGADKRWAVWVSDAQRLLFEAKQKRRKDKKVGGLQ